MKKCNEIGPMNMLCDMLHNDIEIFFHFKNYEEI